MIFFTTGHGLDMTDHMPGDNIICIIISLLLDGPDTTAALPYPAVAADALDGDMMVLADASAGWLSHTNTHGQGHSYSSSS